MPPTPWKYALSTAWHAWWVVLVLALMAGCGVTTPTPASGEPMEPESLQQGILYRTLDADWKRTAEVAALVEAAKREGAVHITTYSQDQVDAWCSAFTREFGIACSGRGLSGAQMVATLITEREAGVAATDVIHLSMSQALHILDRSYVATVGLAQSRHRGSPRLADATRVWGTQ